MHARCKFVKYYRCVLYAYWYVKNADIKYCFNIVNVHIALNYA